MTSIRNIFIALALLTAGAMPTMAAPAADSAQRELAAQTSSVVVRAGYVELRVSGTEGVTFHIYAITGQQVKSVNVPGGTTVSVDLPKGVYIVKGDHWAKQVVIR